MDNLTNRKRAALAALAFVIVAFGQPAWIPFLGVAAGVLGYALFWGAIFSVPSAKQRFWFATGWFTAVQLVQLSWSLSHPFYYIYFFWFLFSFAMGLQFGLLSLLIDREKITQISRILIIAACWTLLEWGRLFILSGYSWNPAGLALTGNIYSLQTASLFGAYGLSFIVILTNLLALRAWRLRKVSLWLIVAALPYLYGGAHLLYHSSVSEQKTLSAVLVQPSFPVEESLKFHSREEFFRFVFNEWRHLLKISAKHQGKPVDLVVLPEMVVPFGTYTFIFPHDEVETAFEEAFGKEALSSLPPLEYPLAYEVSQDGIKRWMVNNAYWAQALANLFDAPLVIGLEDAEDVKGNREYYSAAAYFLPGTFEIKRYAKRILVPMGEYIPLSFVRELAAQYGVLGSFTPGQSAEVWNLKDTTFGVSICYEEMFGNMMRENRKLGANFLLNITSDAWFPRSKLVRQHLEHSRLRTVENGFPLVRACNTGITCVIDSFGRDIAVLGDNDIQREDLADSLYASIPLYNYQTLYTRAGDTLIVGLSFFLLVFLCRWTRVD